MRRYRLDVPLSRELSASLLHLQEEVKVKTGKRVPKAKLAAKILEQFFEKDEGSLAKEACSSVKKL